jgi:hypothetical protein
VIHEEMDAVKNVENLMKIPNIMEEVEHVNCFII